MHKKPRLLQLLLDNQAKPRQLRAETTGDEATIYLYDVIDDYYGVSANEFVKALAGITAKTIHLRINSPGGDVFAARAMATAIKGHASKVIAHIDGVAASAATYIALAAAEVEIAQGAFLMVHKAWTLAWGNADDLLATAALLEKVDGSIANDYAKKTGASAEQIEKWMADETWFTADEALAAKFVDRIFEGETVDGKWDLGAYDNAPKPQAKTVEPDAELANLRAHLERRLTFFERVPA